ncbi:Hypp5882 [Branchiostoma lanceolatum]|uniref:Hypp5882 protein n=1 Tax=Branchiostoma lanceolatum TaxID=7740 RepID=A0A8J9YR92_BRALA|nr:Hypp5882 [Branchiostoma lanceolatum]
MKLLEACRSTWEVLFFAWTLKGDTDQAQSRSGSRQILQELSPTDLSFFTGGAERRTCRRRDGDVTVKEWGSCRVNPRPPP